MCGEGGISISEKNKKALISKENKDKVRVRGANIPKKLL